jgi:hypothetical protein
MQGWPCRQSPRLAIVKPFQAFQGMYVVGFAYPRVRCFATTLWQRPWAVKHNRFATAGYLSIQLGLTTRKLAFRFSFPYSFITKVPDREARRIRHVP